MPSSLHLIGERWLDKGVVGDCLMCTVLYHETDT